jgi:hypothetical protein
VVATIIGAYIVNHYIVAKPADAPAAAAVSTADPKKAEASDAANIPAAGVKAKGISEKAILEKTAAEKPAVADKPDQASGIPVEPRRHQPAPRDKAVAKVTPADPTPAAATPNPAPVEAAVTPEEKRDANVLARAAIERLRGTNEPSPHVQEAVRIPEAPRVPADPPRIVSAPPLQPLPPPIMVSTPRSEAFNPGTGSVPMKPPSAPVAQIDDPRRPTPPADIPSSRPIELRAEAAELAPRERSSVADDVLSAAKSVFHAVLPR